MQGLQRIDTDSSTEVGCIIHIHGNTRMHHQRSHCCCLLFGIRTCVIRQHIDPVVCRCTKICTQGQLVGVGLIGVTTFALHRVLMLVHDLRYSRCGTTCWRLVATNSRAQVVVRFGLSPTYSLQQWLYRRKMRWSERSQHLNSVHTIGQRRCWSERRQLLGIHLQPELHILWYILRIKTTRVCISQDFACHIFCRDQHKTVLVCCIEYIYSRGHLIYLVVGIDPFHRAVGSYVLRVRCVLCTALRDEVVSRLHRFLQCACLQQHDTAQQ